MDQMKKDYSENLQSKQEAHDKENREMNEKHDAEIKKRVEE